jgi:hypothetical protein
MVRLSRREFLRRAATIGMGCAGAGGLLAGATPPAADASEPFFGTRGAVPVVGP